MNITSPRTLRLLTYLAIFFLTLTISLSSYVDSSYLQKTFGESWVSIIFCLSALVNIVAVFATPYLISKMGIRLSTIVFTVATILGLFALILNHLALAVVAFGFIIYYSLSEVAKYNSDLYLETISKDHDTGGIRGVYMTIINIAWLISPLAATIIIGEQENFSALYLLCAVVLIPFIIIVGKILPDRKSVKKQPSFLDVLKRLKKLETPKDKALRVILVADFLLNFFYALEIIYLPLFLHNTIGFSWHSIGIVFTCMLIPFVVIEYPLGKIADKWLGERELLTAGFLIAGIATFYLSTLTKPDIWWWAIILFITRIGAAMIEIMKETALFKRIDGHDAPVLSLSRNMIPLTFMIAPFIALLVINLGGTQATIFSLLGVIMILGAGATLTLKDTK